MKKSHAVGNYRIFEDMAGNLYIERTDGKKLRHDDRQNIENAIKNTFRYYRDEILTREADTILPVCDWYFPNTNRDLLGVCGGVYFVTSENIPGCIKIGYTGNSVYARAGQLVHHGASNPQIYAFARTHQYKMLERGLHARFSDFRVDGEWFELEPVAEFVEQFRGGAK